MSLDPVFTPEEIVSATGAARLVGRAGVCLGVSTDSRTIQPGDLFVALRGPRFDGHDFLTQAFRKGAAAALVERNTEVELEGTVWRVGDTLRALGDLARFHRDRFSLEVVAITGSCGKTTTKEMVRHLLSERPNVVASPGTQNNLIGVPLALFGLTPQSRAAVLELGTNQWGELARLTEMARPTVGAVTNIGMAHLTTFGDLQGVLRAKGELWERLEPGACLVLNADDPLLRRAGQKLGRRIVWFSCLEETEVQASRIVLEPWASRALVNGKWELTVPLPGLHNLMNALAALACAQALGQDLGAAVERLASMAALPGRLTLRQIGGALFLDDTYNANPNSYRAALEVLMKITMSGRRIVVAGDMLEQGTSAPERHAELGRWIGTLGVEGLVAVGRFARTLIQAAQKGESPPQGTWSFDEARQAGEFLTGFVQRGDVILVKGSRGMKMEEVLGCFTTCSPR